MFENITARSLSSVTDTFSSQSHSKDFIFARSDYMRTRLMMLSLIFTVLTPFWALFDWFLLPTVSLTPVFLARIIMFVGLMLTAMACTKNWEATKANFLLSVTLFSLPSLFYVVVLISLPDNYNQNLIGYSFIPYLLVVTLSILPFTLIESLTLGIGLLVLQFFSSWMISPGFTAKNIQDLWLLTALLTIVVTTNHFQLSLLLRLYRQATHDSLTGLLNRVALASHTELIENLEPRPPISITLLDIDHFKKINDSYGHSVGDEVLRLFSSLLKKIRHKNETICRYGGEEFLIISTHTDKETAAKRAEYIRQLTLQLEPKSLDNEPFKLSVSLGVSLLRPTETIHSAIQRADGRLYVAKRTGRNCVVATDQTKN